MTELYKKVIGNISPITMADCVYIGDGTNSTVKDKLDLLSQGGSNKYAGKKALWLGDSISVASNPTYPKYVCDKLGMILTNKASSGGNANRMRDILQGGNTDGTEYQAIENISQFDYVFIMIGHNCDILTNTGETINKIPTDSTPYTDYPTGYYAPVGSCIEYIWGNNRDCKIFLITPIQSTNSRYAETTPKAQHALKEIGNFYSIPVIDAYAECGICKKNIGIYTDDTIHPNNSGVIKLGEYIVNYLLHH